MGSMACQRGYSVLTILFHLIWFHQDVLFLQEAVLVLNDALQVLDLLQLSQWDRLLHFFIFVFTILIRFHILLL